MGVYSEYLNRQLSFIDLTSMRQKLLRNISNIRKRPIIVYASDITKNGPNSIDYSDLLPFSDQLSNLSGDEIDIILETPGGIAEVVEDLVKMVRSKFNKVGIIIPGTAKSAGTIFTMAADEILMGPNSSLGPIDAQIISNGKRYSADAFLEGFNKIRIEAQKNKQLDIAYIPILQNISPGEIQHCENAQNFSRKLVTDWLREYKFKFWETHSSDGRVVTEEDKEKRAEEIATLLCKQERWLTHGRSIKINDLKDMKLLITDYSTEPVLYDNITKYYTLLRMSFETNVYKIYETTNTQIYRTIETQSPPAQNTAIINPIIFDFKCEKCGAVNRIQVNLKPDTPQLEGTISFPSNNIYRCPKCGAESNLLSLRQQIEAQIGKKVV